MAFTKTAGLVDGAGLVSRGGIYGQAGLYSPVGFNPLSLDPYLLFDARDSMLGELESPTLDLDPATPSTLDVITATRSGVATYTDADGLIQTAPENTVRVDHVDGVPMVLIEPSATNLLEYSEDFSNSYWNTSIASVAVDYGYLSPRGDSTASKVTKQTANGHLFGNGVAGAKSIYIKGTAGETVHALDRYTDANTLITLTGEWQRVELDGVNVIFYAVDFRGGTATEVYIWGAQLETGSVATSYIPTSGSTVTRAADNLVIDGSAFSDFFNSGGDGTFYIEFTTKNILDPQTFILVGHSGTQRYFYTNATDPRLLGYDGTSTSSFGGGSIQTTLNRAALSYNSSITKSSLNGATDASVSHSGALSNSTELNIGSSYGDSQHLNGHIKRLIYWPTHSDSL